MLAGKARALPSVDRLLRSPQVQVLLQQYAREAVVSLVRRVVAETRAAALQGALTPDEREIAEQIGQRAALLWSEWPRPVFNATGVVLHTNMGRAPLSAEALAAAQRASDYNDLEIDLHTGGRGSRQDRVSDVLVSLLPAERAHVVVNAAAAVTLALATLARGKDVIVSRGQAVEIGGGFRVPVILRQSGARLVEVGTTNRTRISDYAEAIGPRTGALLHVHTSNFQVVGFTEAVALADLASLGRGAGVPVIADNGSGALLDTAAFGLTHEPMPAEALAAGVDVVAFSGDKLLGGPQAGILAGRGAIVERLARHPLSRALRPDKIVLAALFATLMAYVRGDAADVLPLWRMIAQDGQALRDRADVWRQNAAQQGLRVELEAGESAVGGGSLPGQTLSTTLLVLPHALSAARLRRAPVPVLARVRGGRTLLDLRTIPQESDSALLSAVIAAGTR